MKLRRVIFAAIFAAVLSSQAQAAFTWLNDPNLGDRLDIKYANFENRVLNVGDDLFGVGYVTTIENLTAGNTAWANVTDPGEITLIFNDYVVQSVSPTTAIAFDGGQVQFFYDDSPDADLTDPLQGTNIDPDAGQGYSDGSLWLHLQGTSGVVMDDPLTLGYDESNATLWADLDALTGFENNSGKGLFDVVGGDQAAAFNSNVGWNFNPTADMRLQSTLTDQGDPNGIGRYPIRSNDPIEGVYSIPEPAGALV